MKLSLRLFGKNKLLNILISAQICASVIFGVIAVAIIADDYIYYNLSQSLESAYAYMPTSENVYYTDSAVISYMESGEINLSRARTEGIWGYDPTIEDPYTANRNSSYSIDAVYSFGSLISENMQSQLKKGRWYSEEVQDGMIECVIIGDESQFSIGSVIDGALYEWEYEQGVGLSFSIINAYKFKVVGTCGNSAEVLSFSGGSVPAIGLGLDSLYTTVSYDSENYFEQLSNYTSGRYSDDSDSSTSKPTVTILCSINALYGDSVGLETVLGGGKNALFTFAESVSDERKEEILADLKNEAGVVDIAQVREVAYVTAKGTTSQYVPLLLCFIVMAVAGIVCVGVLNMIKNKRDFRIYSICGMSFCKGVLIMAIYTGIIMVLSVVLSFLVMLTISFLGYVPWYSMYWGAPSVIFAIADFLISAILVLVSGLPVLKATPHK